MLTIPILCALSAVVYAAWMRAQKPVYLFALVVFLLSTILSLVYFVSDDITGEGITEATLFHLMYGFDGIDLAGFSVYVALSIICLVAIPGIGYFGWKSCTRQTRRGPSYRPSVIVHLTVIGALSVFAVGAHPATLDTMQVVEKFNDARYNGLLSEELRELDGIAPPKRGKSLVYIYAESMERTFFDKRIFPGLIQELAKLEESSLSIRGIGQAPLTDWTIAGMVASQCGIPLATFRSNRNDLGDLKSFMPGATCLGDILNQAGYRLAYMGGADLSFAGKGQFYRDHSFSDVTGLKELQNRLGEDIPLSKWGVYDDRLFEQAVEKFRELSKTGEPFALIMLTLDTHAPTGHETPTCARDPNLGYRDGSSKMLNAVKCSDRLIARFVEQIEAEAGNDVVIVVASDHWQMRSDAAEPLSRSPVRENLFLVRGAGIEPGVISKPSTTMDIAPTVLSLLGWDISTFALGRNLLRDEPTLVEKFGRAQYYDMVKSWRMNLWRVWEGQSQSDSAAPALEDGAA